MPPELSSQMETPSSAEALTRGQFDDIRQFYFKTLTSSEFDPTRNKELVKRVLAEARRVVKHPSRPTQIRNEPFSQNPLGDLAFDETLEENPTLRSEGEFLVETEEEKSFRCVTLLDASASMAGEKHLLASIAVAVLLLEVPPKDAALIVFNSKSKSIKDLNSIESRETTLLRFLGVKPRGFTNIESGLREGLKQFRSKGRLRKIGLIATDGRSTEGEDPIEVASEYDFLLVLHLHGPGSHLDASRDIAQAGHGICLEVEDFAELPRRLYDAVRTLARRS
jgi:Mg-chelatase subunit ChlD